MQPVSGEHSFVRFGSVMANEQEVDMLIYIAIVMAALATAFLMMRVFDLYPGQRGVNKSETQSSAREGQKQKHFADESNRGSHRKTAVRNKLTATNLSAVKTPWGW